MSYVDWIRGQLGRQKIFLVFASACIRDESGRVLWQRRADFGWWGLPGGVLELDESLPQCVAREVREETGLEVEPLRLLGVYTSPDYDVTYPNGDQVQQVTACFECRPVGEAFLTPDGDETLDLAWFPLHDPPPTAPWYRAMLYDLALNRPMASYRRGKPGNHRAQEPYYKKLRRIFGPAPFVMPSALALVQDEAGRVLLIRRGDTGLWGLPGGAIEFGERVDQTVVNEVREETGLEVKPVRLLGVYSGQRFWLKYPHGDEVKIVSSLFECRVVGGELRPDGVESLDARFFPIDALPDMAPRTSYRLRDGLADTDETIFDW